MKRTAIRGYGGSGRTFCVVLVLLVSAWTVGCMMKVEEPTAPNLLLITLDTTRRDHCSVYGYERGTTPNLVMLAEQGVRFDLAYAPMSVTGPTHATIFTSLYPIGHGVVKNALKLGLEYQTLAEILAENGYQTAAVVSSFALNGKFGYAQGFEEYDDDFGEAEPIFSDEFWPDHLNEGGLDRRAHHTTRQAIGWLDERRKRNQPFFLFVHYFDPHAPYVPPIPFAELYVDPNDRSDYLQYLTDLYDAEIAFTDWQVGVLLEALDKLSLERNTLVVLVGDHGEGLMQHGYLLHGPNIYEEAVRVPLLVRWPDQIAAGQVLSSPVEMVDLFPTILDLLGIEPPPVPIQGRSLAAALYGDEELDPERPVYLHRRPYKERMLKTLPKYNPQSVDSILVKGQKYAIRVGRWKYIEGAEEGTKELFDLDADPGEGSNLYSKLPEKAAALALQLESWRLSHTPDGLVQVPVSNEDEQRLHALGYVD